MLRPGPWFGLASLALASVMVGATWYLITPEGQKWFEDLCQPLGYAVILVGIAGPLVFLGFSVVVSFLALQAVLRREPFWFGETAVTLVVSIILHVGRGFPNPWDGYVPRLCVVALFVAGCSAAIRSFRRRSRPT